MTDVELRLTADTDGATSGVRGFRKEYADLVKAIERPIRQIDALRKTQDNAKTASSAYFEARKRVEDLKRAIEQAEQPVKELDRAYGQAQRTLAKATLEFDRQKAKLREQRAELKAAGVDTRNLAGEQQRLQAAMATATGKGQADAAIHNALETFGVARLRQLREQLVTLRSDYARLQQAGVLSASERVSAEIRYQASLAQTKKQIAELSTAEGGGLGGGGLTAITARLAGVVAAAYTVQRAAGSYFAVADAVNSLEDRMRNALPVQEEYARSQARLEQISKSVRIPIEQTSELFLGAVGPLREMGFSAKTTADLVGALSAGLVANKVTGQQAEAVINQFNKGLQTGVIRGEAFNAVLENSSALTDALQKGLGVTRSELIRMANAGELTTEKVVSALTSQSGALLALTDAMRVTTEDARNTLSDSIDRVVQSIDQLLGLSDLAVRELDKISEALDRAAKGESKGITDLVGYLGVPGMAWSKAAELYREARGESAQSLEAISAAEQKSAQQIEDAQERKLSAMRRYATGFNDIQAEVTKSFETALKDQIAAQNKANSKLDAAKKAQLETEKRYKAALDKLRTGATGTASYGNAQRLQYAAGQALKSGDIESAKKNAQHALEMLVDLAEAGENTYGFEGFIKSLQTIEQQADRLAVERAEKARQVEIDKVREFKKEFEELKNFKITPSIDDAALAAATAKMQRWAQMIGKDVKIAPRVLPAESAATGQGWHVPLLAPKGAAVEPVPVTVKPVAIQSGEGAAPVVEAQIKPAGIRQDGLNSFTNLPPVPVDLIPAGIRQDGSNSWTNLPPVPVDVVPAGIRQDGENSFTNLPAVPVDILPAGIRQHGENSFTNLPPVDVELVMDQAAAQATALDVQALADEFRKRLTVPVTLAGAAAGLEPPASDSMPGFAPGGWTGPGGKYQPAGVVHAGEHVQPQEVVREPGALAFLERIRRNGFRATLDQLRLRGYANGGPVVPVPRFVPNVPAPSPALLEAAAGPNVTHMGSLDISIGGSAPVTLQGPPDALRELSIAARKFGRTHR